MSAMGIESESRDGVLTLRLNRPGKLNAIDHAMATGLLTALSAADASEDVRVVLLRGNGRAFCAGRDVSEPPSEDDLQLVQHVASALVRCRKPIVAAVHGWVVGAGLEWMLDADVVIGARSARFKLPEAGLGVFVTGGISAILPRVAGLSRAKALLLLGEEFSVQQAQQWGLVWAIVDDDQLEHEAQRVAQRLASLEPRVVTRFKRVLNEVGLDAFDQAIALESAMMRELMKE
jgi:2-(1,2-epoxy-1,2-dihydrophenyl)acetyl-CoA isomerase